MSHGPKKLFFIVQCVRLGDGRFWRARLEEVESRETRHVTTFVGLKETLNAFGVVLAEKEGSSGASARLRRRWRSLRLRWRVVRRRRP